MIQKLGNSDWVQQGSKYLESSDGACPFCHPWPLRRIEQATGVRRKTAGDYLRSAGVVVRSPGSWGRKSLAKPATLVTTNSERSKAATSVITDFALSVGRPEQNHKRSESASEAYRELIELELSRGRNAMGIWQDLVDRHGFAGGYQSVKRFVRKLRGAVSPEARVIIVHSEEPNP